MPHDLIILRDAPVSYMPLEVSLAAPDDFLKVKETLTRIGVASKTSKTLYQSCHILHKQNRYFIIGFKELFALDGKLAEITDNDLERRNRIASLLASWNLVTILHPEDFEVMVPMSQIKIVSHKDKSQWVLQSKYGIGQKK